MTQRLDLVGIGSVVLDRIFQTDSILGPDAKGMVREYTEVVGGVTLNHVAWARVLGLRTGLFGRQGDDAPGRQIRAYVDALRIDRTHLRTDGEGSSTANIFVDPTGERCIYMQRAATATTTPEHIDAHFAEYIRGAAMVSTEISQLPLPTTVRVLEIAHEAGIPTALDVDIPLSQATGEAALGTVDEANRAMALATILKPAKSAVREMFPVGTTVELARTLFAEFAIHTNVRLVALTDGAAGCVVCDGTQTLHVPAYPVTRVVDTTGAGDAFFGGLLAGYRCGLELTVLGKLANACGAACVGQIGATPDPAQSHARVLEWYDGPPLPASMGGARGGERAPASGGAAAVEDCLAVLGEEFAHWVQTFDRESVVRAAALIEASRADGGRVHVTGVGKPEHIARYGAALLSSTGTPAQFLHATECVHGSAGQVLADDVVIAISNSGGTPEVLAAVDTVKRLGARIIAVTGNPASALGTRADAVLAARVAREGGPLDLAPRASVLVETAALAVLSAALQARRGLTREEYARWHPHGVLGAKARER